MSVTPTTDSKSAKGKPKPAALVPPAAATFRQLMEASKTQLQQAIPKHVNIERFIRVALTTVQRTPGLLDCTMESLLGCIFQCAQLGLEPDGLLGHAYLVPFRDKQNNRTLCTLIVGYRGMIKLALQSGVIKSISARVVYSKDYFDYEFGLEDKLVHKPVHGDPGELIYAYCIFRYKDGGYHFDVMSSQEIEAIRMRSKTGNSDMSPWKTDYDEMAKKTVIRRTSKMAPASVEDLHRAALYDSRAEAGLPPIHDIEIPRPAIDLPGSAPGEQGRRLSLARPPAVDVPTDQPQAIGEELFAEIEAALTDARDLTASDVCKWFGVDHLNHLTQAQGVEALGRIHDAIAEEAPEPGSNG